jgi:hypothetical protein
MGFKEGEKQKLFRLARLVNKLGTPTIKPLRQAIKIITPTLQHIIQLIKHLAYTHRSKT